MSKHKFFSITNIINKSSFITAVSIIIGIFIIILSFIVLLPQHNGKNNNNSYPSPTPTPKPLACSNINEWKTYTSTHNLYQLELPENFTITEDENLRNDFFDNYTQIKIDDNSLILITFLTEKESKKYISLANFAQKEKFINTTIKTQEQFDISISGYKGYKFKFNPDLSLGPTVIVKIDKQYAVFMYLGNKDFPEFSNQEKANCENIFDQIFASFKFVN